MIITASIFEAGSKCLTKCFLRSLGEAGAGNVYTDWIRTKSDSCHREGIKRLMAGAAHDECIRGLSGTGKLKTAKWRFAVDLVAHSQNLESTIHTVERIPSEGHGKSAQFIPIRFTFFNKLTRDDKLLLAFDALVLSELLGREVSLGRIIHGDTYTTLKVKTPALMKEVRKLIRKIDAVFSGPSPPDFILKRHCSECEFQSQCRQRAIEKDDLSLLAGMTEKERRKFNSKGIFTVTQLSYTFRPRRRPRRLAAKREKYHHSLKALSIRDNKFHIVGSPELKIAGTPVFLDVEGLPDCDSYYLIGVRIKTVEGIVQHSLWADTAADEERIWISFLDILSGIDSPVLIHFGSFETKFLKEMCDRYGGPPKDSAASKAITSSINLLALIFAQVYFPTYSNGLKEISRFLGFEWTDPSSSGLQSIVWRHQWEESHDPTAREKLITYNANDCEAISLVAQTLGRFTESDIGVNKSPSSESKIVHVESLGNNLTSLWRPFKSPLSDLEQINSAAYWNYQRDRVFVRSGVSKKKTTRPSMSKPITSAEMAVFIKTQTSCPNCGKRGRKKARLLPRTVRDIVFGRNSVKGRVVKYVFQTYSCRSCGREYGLHEWYLHGCRKYGWNMLAYTVYHVVHLNVPQLTMKHTLNRLFGFSLVNTSLSKLKSYASDYYLLTKGQILEQILLGNLIHADETRANIKGRLAYVWVLTNLREVVYILAESRQGDIVYELLKGFKGVLVTDFYTAYDAIECPQQKCLIHLMRDLNDEILNNPFDEEMKSIVAGFAGLLKPMIETIDLRGLKKYFLQKHLVEVDRFYKFLDKSEFKSEAATKCKQRFEKNRDKLFTFPRYDGVPWNNNNAEHAIKAFARLQKIISGLSNKRGIDEYLTLLSIAETCEYQGLDFLDFLRSGEKDIHAFAESKLRRRGNNVRLPMIGK